MTQIATFVNDISDEFKIVVVKAVEALCMKFPKKHAIMMNFLSSMLRDEGGLNYKACITQTFINLIEAFPDSKEKGLSHLCELIEDCEHTDLSVKVLHMLGTEGPKTSRPRRYIRYIYNRVILENAEIRAAAVTALAKFGAESASLRPNILVLLAHCQLDTDDEVRDRATYYRSVLEQQSLCNEFVLLDSRLVAIKDLQSSLVSYLSTDCSEAAPHLNIMSENSEAICKPRGYFQLSAMDTKIPSDTDLLNEFGRMIKSSTIYELTEEEAEIIVHCKKHVFEEHLVIQFLCSNTLSDQVLYDLDVTVDTDTKSTLVKTLPCTHLRFGVSDSIYVVLRMPEDLQDAIGIISPTLSFSIKDCDPLTGMITHVF